MSETQEDATQEMQGDAMLPMTEAPSDTVAAMDAKDGETHEQVPKPTPSSDAEPKAEMEEPQSEAVPSAIDGAEVQGAEGAKPVADTDLFTDKVVDEEKVEDDGKTETIVAVGEADEVTNESSDAPDRGESDLLGPSITADDDAVEVEQGTSPTTSGEEAGTAAATSLYASEFKVETANVITDEDTPLLAKDSERLSGKSFVPVIKDEYEEPVIVTTTSVSDDGAPQENIGDVVKKVLGQVGKGTASMVDVVGRKTREIGDHVGGETKKVTQRVSPHVAKLARNLDTSTRQLRENVGTSTRRLTEHVGKESQKIALNVGTSTRQLTEHVGRESQKLAQNVGQSTRELTENVGREGKKLAVHVSTETKKVADKVAPHATKYWLLIKGTAPGLSTGEGDRIWLQLLDGTIRSFGQVLLCDNPVTGGMVLLAILIGSPLGALCALFCSGLANCCAILVGVESSFIRRGHMASNAVLFGSGITTYVAFEGAWGWLALFIVTAIGAVATLLAYLLTLRIATSAEVPTLLFPYVGVMLFVLLGSQLWGSASLSHPEIAEGAKFHFFESVLKGTSQIFIVENTVSGFFILLGMVPCSGVLAGASFIGSILGALFSLAFFSIPTGLINAGLQGFNCALSLPALLFFFVPTWKLLVVGFFGVILTLIAQASLEEFFATWSLPVMVIPFCLSTLLFVAVDLKGSNAAHAPFMELIPQAELSTPEDHYRRFVEKSVYSPIPDIEDVKKIEEGEKEEIEESTEEALNVVDEEEVDL